MNEVYFIYFFIILSIIRNIFIISKFQVDDFNFIAYYCDLNCLLLLYKRWEISDLYKKFSLINLKKYLMIFNYSKFLIILIFGFTI